VIEVHLEVRFEYLHKKLSPETWRPFLPSPPCHQSIGISCFWVYLWNAREAKRKNSPEGSKPRRIQKLEVFGSTLLSRENFHPGPDGLTKPLMIDCWCNSTPSHRTSNRLFTVQLSKRDDEKDLGIATIKCNDVEFGRDQAWEQMVDLADTEYEWMKGEDHAVVPMAFPHGLEGNTSKTISGQADSSHFGM
jgi:hypothetical protein